MAVKGLYFQVFTSVSKREKEGNERLMCVDFFFLRYAATSYLWHEKPPKSFKERRKALKISSRK